MPTKSKKSTKKQSSVSSSFFKKPRFYIVTAIIAILGVAVTIGSHAATTAPTVMTLSASVVGPTQVNFSWTQPSGITPAVDDVYRIVNNGTPLWDVHYMTSASQAGTSAAYGLAPGTTHSYSVQLIQWSTGKLLGQSNSVSVTTPAALPVDSSVIAAPTGLTVSLAAYNHAHLEWTASTTVGVTGYNIYENGWYVGTVSGNTFEKLIPTNQSSSYTVKAINAANNESAASNYVSIFAPSPSTGLGGVSGVVSDSYGTPGGQGVTTITATDATGKQVTSLTTDSPNISAITAAPNGSYKVNGLAPGNYTLSFAAKGYATQKVAISVTANVISPLNVTMTAGTGGTTTTTGTGNNGKKH